MRHRNHFVEELAERNEETIGRMVPLASVEPDPAQPRSTMGDLEELANSIRDKGVLEPILVRRTRNDGQRDGLTIISGERRYRAALQAGLIEIPVIEMDVGGDEALEIALIENLHRRDLHPFEEAAGYASLSDKHGYTQQQIAASVGKSRVSITEAMSLLEIPEDLRERCRRADIDARSVLLEIARLGDRKKMEEAIALVASGSTRDDLREQKKGKPGEAEKRREFHFVYSPKDGPFKLNISFHKSRVAKAELIDALRGVLKQLESGELELTKK